MKRQWINYIVLLVFIPIVIWFGVTFLEDRRYVFISLVIVLITMFPIFQSLEMRTMNVRLLVILAVMTALRSEERRVGKEYSSLLLCWLQQKKSSKTWDVVNRQT